VAEEELAVVGDEERAAAVLVDAGARVERRRVDVDAASRSASHSTTTLRPPSAGRPSLAKIRAAGDRDLAEAHRRRGELGSRKRRGPAAEGRGAHRAQ
jgi:hypothetical protein